jgi:hypothetical protein
MKLKYIYMILLFLCSFITLPPPHPAMLQQTFSALENLSLIFTTLKKGAGRSINYVKCPNNYALDCIDRVKKYTYKITKCFITLQPLDGIS